MFRRQVKIAIGAFVAAVFLLGTAALFVPAEAAPSCLCPDIYAPVRCSNGKTYPNLCVATCQRAKNCVPTGDI
jgi:hypothetical protein